MKTLHIAELDKFIPPIIELIRNIETGNKQKFLTFGDIKCYPYLMKNDSLHVSNNGSLKYKFRFFYMLREMASSDKIIIHGLFDFQLVLALFFSPWLLKKCYWAMWGADLYYHDDRLYAPSFNKKIKEFFRSRIIKNMGHLVTYIPGDVALARKWYKAKGKHVTCLMYKSNTVKTPVNENTVYPKSKYASEINIQVGNSADPCNNHEEILTKLVKYKDENIFIYAPLSYGNMVHAEKIKKMGSELFGDKFIPMMELLPKDEYNNFLEKVDIAVFNHERQQAMGNTISLIGMGKTVYCRIGTSQWDFFKDLNINIKNTSDLSLEKLSEHKVKNNIKIIEDIFSEDNLISQYCEMI